MMVNPIFTTLSQTVSCALYSGTYNDKPKVEDNGKRPENIKSIFRRTNGYKINYHGSIDSFIAVWP